MVLRFALFGFSACEIKDFFASFRFRFSRNGGIERFRAVRQSSSLCRHALTLFMPSLCSASASHYASLCSGCSCGRKRLRRHSPIPNWVRIQHSDPVFHILLPSLCSASASHYASLCSGYFWASYPYQVQMPPGQNSCSNSAIIFLWVISNVTGVIEMRFARTAAISVPSSSCLDVNSPAIQ